MRLTTETAASRTVHVELVFSIGLSGKELKLGLGPCQTMLARA